jgi:hypothetical protein
MNNMPFVHNFMVGGVELQSTAPNGPTFNVFSNAFIQAPANMLQGLNTAAVVPTPNINVTPMAASVSIVNGATVPIQFQLQNLTPVHFDVGNVNINVSDANGPVAFVSNNGFLTMLSATESTNNGTDSLQNSVFTTMIPVPASLANAATAIAELKNPAKNFMPNMKITDKNKQPIPYVETITNAAFASFAAGNGVAGVNPLTTTVNAGMNAVVNSLGNAMVTLPLIGAVPLKNLPGFPKM